MEPTFGLFPKASAVSEAPRVRRYRAVAVAVVIGDVNRTASDATRCASPRHDAVEGEPSAAGFGAASAAEPSADSLTLLSLR